jgi:hypothetical protein
MCSFIHTCTIDSEEYLADNKICCVRFNVLTATIIRVLLFWATLCIPSGQKALLPEDGGSMFLRNVGNHTLAYDITQKHHNMKCVFMDYNSCSG